jgi:hypothetical protein
LVIKSRPSSLQLVAVLAELSWCGLLATRPERQKQKEMGVVKDFILLIMVFEANEDCFLSQAPQEEMSQVVLNDGSVEKTVRLRALCKVEWFENGQSAVVMPVSTDVSAISKICISIHISLAIALHPGPSPVLCRSYSYSYKYGHQVAVKGTCTSIDTAVSKWPKTNFRSW